MQWHKSGLRPSHFNFHHAPGGAGPSKPPPDLQAMRASLYHSACLSVLPLTHRSPRSVKIQIACPPVLINMKHIRGSLNTVA